MGLKRRFSKSILAEIDENKMLAVRSGTEHRFTAIWAVVVNGRVFVRSWNDKQTGWRKAFVKEPRGAIQIADREVLIRAINVRGAGLMKTIDSAYEKKYNTPASVKWVRGLVHAKRRATTAELLPRQPLVPSFSLKSNKSEIK